MTSAVSAPKPSAVTPLDFARRVPKKPVSLLEAAQTAAAERAGEIAKCRANHPAGKKLVTPAL